MLKRYRYKVLSLKQYYAFAIREIVLLLPSLLLFLGQVRISLRLFVVNLELR